MNFEPGWLMRQIERASEEVRSWLPHKREIMFCNDEHSWGPITKVSETQEQRTCIHCDRQQIRFTWAEDWVYVKRGFETK